MKTLNDLKVLIASNDNDGIYKFFNEINFDEFVKTLKIDEMKEFMGLLSEAKNTLLAEQKSIQMVLKKIKTNQKFL